MSEQLSWPIEKIEPSTHNPDWWRVLLKGQPQAFNFTADELAAAGIPAQPYPPEPVTITVTVGDRSEVVELDDAEADYIEGWSPVSPTAPGPADGLRKIGAALRRLGVQP